MIAMLREAGIDSLAMLVDTRDEGKVHPDFPSPLQFNHCIVAIPMAEPVADALVIHPEMGPVLVFDPTDDLTPMGDLPWVDQGTRALLVHPDHGGLVELPVLPAEANRAERTWSISLHRDGGAVVEMRAAYHGQYAVLMRDLCFFVSGNGRAQLSGMPLRGFSGAKRFGLVRAVVHRALAAAGFLVAALALEEPCIAPPVGVSQVESLAWRKPQPCRPAHPTY